MALRSVLQSGYHDIQQATVGPTPRSLCSVPNKPQERRLAALNPMLCAIDINEGCFKTDGRTDRPGRIPTEQPRSEHHLRPLHQQQSNISSSAPFSPPIISNPMCRENTYP